MPNGGVARLLENRRAAFYEFGERGWGDTPEERQVESALRAQFELEDVVLTLLVQAKIDGERVGASPAEYSLSPRQISERIGIFSEAVWGANTDEIVCGILGKLVSDGLAAKHAGSSGGAEGAKAYTVIDVSE